MATPAVPSQAFGDVQRYLRQKRATGQEVSPREEKLAWEAYWDSMSSQRHISAQLGMDQQRIDNEETYRDEMMDLRRDEQDRADDAATISGIVELGGTAATTGMLLKGTKLGSHLGLGSATGTAPPATVAAPVTSGASGTAMVGPTAGAAAPGPITSAGSGTAMVGPAIGGAAAPVATNLAAPTGLSATTGMTASINSATAPAGFSAATGTSGAALGVGTAAAGAAGLVGSRIGGEIAGEKGAVTAGMASGALAGAYASGPYAPIGAIVGAVVGGFSSIVTGGKEGGPGRSKEMIAKSKEIQGRREEQAYGRRRDTDVPSGMPAGGLT